MELTAQLVHHAITSCLFQPEDRGEDLRVVEGIMSKYHLHAVRLEQQGSLIAAMLAELPDQFQERGGGGWSFLNACNDRHGRQWTSEHRTMEALICLGIVTGKARWLLPRDAWRMLPGGMPYFVVAPP